ncbi:MAG: site-2 protease family protein [Clostridia bacterium]|nr:site-2 protease family protein [Clostridia bacterium]
MNFSSIWSILVSLFIISIFIVVHEWGHYITGKKLGFQIDEFAIGMGPKIFGWKRGETEFSIRCIPAGGFCRFAGEDEDDGGDNPRAMNNRPAWARMIMTAAGSIMNILFAIILAIATFAIFGQLQIDDSAYVYEVVADSPAYAAGLQYGDKIVSFDGQQITTVDSAVNVIAQSDGEPAQLIVERNGERIALQIAPEYSEEYDSYKVGVSLSQGQIRVKLTFWESVREGFLLVWETIVAIFAFLRNLFGSLFRKLFVDSSLTVEGTGDVMSIVGVVGIMSFAVRENVELLLWLAVTISANLGVMNLLPIPALDGSRLLFQFYELVTRRRVKPEHEGLVHLIGFALFMALFVVLGIRDVMRFIG